MGGELGLWAAGVELEGVFWRGGLRPAAQERWGQPRGTPCPATMEDGIRGHGAAAGGARAPPGRRTAGARGDSG